MQRIYFVLATLILLTGCAQQNPADTGAGMPSSAGGGTSGLSAFRPKADPAVMQKIRQEEAENLRKAQEAAQQQQAAAEAAQDTNASGRVLPAVSTSPFTQMPVAPPADQASAGGPIVTPAKQESSNPGIPFWPFNQPQQNKPPEIASYGGYGAVPPPPPGAAAGGLVPPPPATTVTGQLYAGMPPMDPYGYMQQPQQPAQPQRPALFGSGSRTTSSDDEGESAPAKKKKDFVPITPTGMEARSPYKQRDDLKVLLKGAIAASPLQRLANKDEKVAQELARLDAGLPSESTKGAFNVSQRQIDTVFKPVPLDKRIAPSVKKLQSDLMQAYYRYLYSYNKWALAQQTVAARKQEVDVASTPAEQQRAAADLAQSQSDADAAKEDMRSAQTELASVSGPQAAATIIQRVSGVKPSVESLAVAQGDSQPVVAAEPAGDKGGGGLIGGVGSLFGFGKSQPKASDAGGAASPKAKDDGKKGKGKKGQPAETAKDLAPAPQGAAKAEAEPEPEAAPAGSSSPISFELKNVNVTPRKSTLKVSIRNNGSENFSFDPDVISLSEGNRKLSEATVRAEFDTTLVQPNQEVTGTITIYGRPWNDRLSVSLNDGGKTIPLKR
jgi:hypothetical protein